MKDRLDLPDTFQVRVWRDSVADRSGVDALGPYPEVYWLPHLGPSAYLLARRLLAVPGEWDKAALAASVGVGSVAMERSLARLEAFRLALAVDGEMHVKRYWPRVSRNLLAKMPPPVQEGEAVLAVA